MKTLTLTSEFFQNECAESFCKAILGNINYPNKLKFMGYCENSKWFILKREQKIEGYIWSNPMQLNSITFKLDDSFSVDWACLHSHGYCYSINLGGNVLNLDYLATLQGVIIEEAGND